MPAPAPPRWRLLAAAPPSGVEGVGSNNWVVAGSHTTTGKPLLANDPHLKLTTPALWYFARLEAPGFTVPPAPRCRACRSWCSARTSTSPGASRTPGPTCRISTSSASSRPTRSRVQTPDGWAALETRRGDDQGQGAADVKLVVRASRHGPLISDAGALAGRASARAASPALCASRCAGPRSIADADPIGAGLALSRARSSVDEFVAAVDALGRADAEHGGRRRGGPHRRSSRPAACRCAGPTTISRASCRRRAGTPLRLGRLGAGGPRRRASSIRRAAGSPPPTSASMAPDYPHYLTSEWALPYRQQRIEQLLRARAQHSPARTCAAMQADLQEPGGGAAAAVAAAGAAPAMRWPPRRRRSSRASTARWPPTARRR